MTDIVNLTLKKFGDLDIQIYGTHENPLFKANEIGKLLGIKKIHESIKDFNEKEKVVYSITDTRGRLQDTNMLTEIGLYKVLMKSRKKEAVQFQDWVRTVSPFLIKF
jgi:prophage antirepressor-like protein